MKKKIGLLMSMVITAMMLLSACGKDMSGSAYLGSWTATTAEYSGIEMSVDTLYDEFKFVLQDNGKVELTIDGQQETGSWDETENGISLDGEMEFTKADENTLTYETEGVIVYFVRE